MQYLMLIYTDDALLEAMPEGQYEEWMRGCLAKADAHHASGAFLASQQLEHTRTARSIRVRDGAMSLVDGPFSETKEMLAGFNLIEADSLDEAVRIASEFPWARVGCIEVRPVRDMDAVRRRVGAAAATEA